MKNFIPALFSICGSITSAAQYSMDNIEPPATKEYAEKNIYCRISNNKLPIKITQYGNRSDIVYINLHNDEFTSVTATRKLLEKEGGLLIQIENKGRRDIHFKIDNISFRVDPNRIFSRKGIAESLKEKGRYSIRAEQEMEKLGQRIIQLFPKNLLCIIALHNNTPDFFSVHDYLPGNKRVQDAAKVYANPDQDPDDLFFTTHRGIYNYVTSGKFNAVLQDNENCRQDGSLSVYCGKNNIQYVNLETEHGKYDQYAEMIGFLYEVLTTKDISSDEYHFTSALNPGTIFPEPGSPVFFGEKKIGKIQSINTNNESGAVRGTILVNNNFPLFNNITFCLLKDESGNNRYEIRINSTIEKKLLDPSNDVLELIIIN